MLKLNTPLDPCFSFSPLLLSNNMKTTRFKADSSDFAQKPSEIPTRVSSTKGFSKSSIKTQKGDQKDQKAQRKEAEKKDGKASNPSENTDKKLPPIPRTTTGKFVTVF